MNDSVNIEINCHGAKQIIQDFDAALECMFHDGGSDSDFLPPVQVFPRFFFLENTDRDAIRPQHAYC